LCGAAADARDIRAEDLAAKLFELSQAMANDWQAFARAVEEETERQKPPS
jgi:hypothetical protein